MMPEHHPFRINNLATDPQLHTVLLCEPTCHNGTLGATRLQSPHHIPRFQAVTPKQPTSYLPHISLPKMIFTSCLTSKMSRGKFIWSDRTGQLSPEVNPAKGKVTAWQTSMFVRWPQ